MLLSIDCYVPVQELTYFAIAYQGPCHHQDGKHKVETHHEPVEPPASEQLQVKKKLTYRVCQKVESSVVNHCPQQIQLRATHGIVEWEEVDICFFFSARLSFCAPIFFWLMITYTRLFFWPPEKKTQGKKLKLWKNSSKFSKKTQEIFQKISNQPTPSWRSCVEKF